MIGELIRLDRRAAGRWSGIAPWAMWTWAVLCWTAIAYWLVRGWPAPHRFPWWDYWICSAPLRLVGGLVMATCWAMEREQGTLDGWILSVLPSRKWVWVKIRSRLVKLLPAGAAGLLAWVCAGSAQLPQELHWQQTGSIWYCWWEIEPWHFGWWSAHLFLFHTSLGLFVSTLFQSTAAGLAAALGLILVLDFGLSFGFGFVGWTVCGDAEVRWSAWWFFSPFALWIPGAALVPLTVRRLDGWR